MARAAMTRLLVSCMIRPSTPVGGVHVAENACTSATVRLMSISGSFRSVRPAARYSCEPGARYAAHQASARDFLTSYSEQNGYAPSFEEIARQFNYNSLATVHEHLTNLERKGYIKRAYNESRAIEILPSEVNPRAVELPLLGSVAAGMPIEAVVSNESISVPEDFVRRGEQHYCLRVRGNSMIDEQIRDGDFVVVAGRNRADNGEMVIALVNNAAATVKKFYRERDGRIRLQPANDTMSPIYVHENEVTIQGIVVGVMRKY
jgi:repressor LexA